MYLLNRGNMSGYVFNANRVFDSQSMALAFYPSLVNEYASIGGKTYIIYFRYMKIKAEQQIDHPPANARQI